jgi:hypothetical protein
MLRPHVRFTTSQAAAARPLFGSVRARFFRGTSLAASLISHARALFASVSLTKRRSLRLTLRLRRLRYNW